MIHDRFDSALQVGAGDAGDARQWRFDRKPARSENAFGIHLRFAATAQHILVARALAFVHEPRTNPPHQRMEPERGLHAHLRRRNQIVVAPDMREFVREDRLDL